MSKWDFIKNLAQKASLKTPNRSDRFRKVLVNNADKIKMSDLENLSETDLNKMYLKQILKDNKAPIAGTVGAGVGYSLGKTNTGDDEEASTGFENIDELSPELLKILIENGYINDPDGEYNNRINKPFKNGDIYGD